MFYQCPVTDKDHNDNKAQKKFFIMTELAMLLLGILRKYGTDKTPKTEKAICLQKAP